jgi:membrane dipeptidase
MKPKVSHDIADCHCDTVWYFNRNDYRFTSLNSDRHVDLPRLLEGRVRVQFFAVCVAADIAGPLQLQETLRYISRYHNCLVENAASLHSVEYKDDLGLAKKEGKIACLLALEGAEALDGSLELLQLFFRLGVRCISLTWNKRNIFADGCGEEVTGGGLTQLGRQIIPMLSKLGVVLDLAHLSARSFFDALELYDRPPLVSHTNARALHDHPRNLTDEQLKAVAARGGVVGLSFYPPFVSGGDSAGLEQLLNHFVHVSGIAGVGHVAIGSDFDGISTSVDQLKDAASYPVLVEGLYRRGFQEGEVEQITIGNVQRLLNDTLTGFKNEYF